MIFLVVRHDELENHGPQPSEVSEQSFPAVHRLPHFADEKNSRLKHCKLSHDGVCGQAAAKTEAGIRGTGKSGQAPESRCFVVEAKDHCQLGLLGSRGVGAEKPFCLHPATVGISGSRARGEDSAGVRRSPNCTETSMWSSTLSKGRPKPWLYLAVSMN